MRRKFLVCLAVASVLLASLAAGVSGAHAGARAASPAVPQPLLDAAKQDKKAFFDVIVTGDGSKKGQKLAQKLSKDLGAPADVAASFSSIAGVQLRLSGKDLLKLSKSDGLVSIVPNADVAPEAIDNTQHWDDATGVRWYWTSPAGRFAAPTIAVVDSGVDNSNNAFGDRLLAQFDLGGGSASGDSRGHGTFVAALAAGAGSTLAGAAPKAGIVSLDVFDANGRGRTSDVIKACDWILQHRADYNIRVANFSLQASQESSFLYDPLDQAVERLWEAGIVVVAAAGNYAKAGQPSGVVYAPGNDPFVITVGAVDINATNNANDDFNPPWSAYGYTHDGFAKPELGAPGRYMIQQLPAGATLFGDYPNNVVKGGSLQLSGTSFAAPIVSGMAADLLASHPDWTPDQVKGVLMASAMPVPKAATNSLGVGEANIQRALALKTTPNPNLGLEQFLIADPTGGPLPIFDVDTWIDVAQSNASWNAASWSSASWSSASWSSASWSSASWSSASWSSASWSSSSWNSASWNNVANNAIGDGTNLNY